jgi:hypothetical protein
MTHNLTSQNFPHFQNRNQGLNEAGVGTGTGQIYPHPINTLIDPTQNRGMEQPRQMHHQQSQHPNPHMQQSYGAGPQPHMSMRNGQTPT